MATRNPWPQRTFREDVIAWIALFVLGGGALLAWRIFSHRTIREASGVSAGASDPRVAVLAFDRIVERPDGVHLDQARLRGHLAALASAGFQPVTLHQLRDFYLRGGPLPQKALLLTFDHGYLSTASAVDPLLRELRWPATLFVMTERQQRRDPLFVFWPQVRQMVDSGIWELGSHGHQGHDPVAVDAAGDEGPFFIRRAWRAEDRREETPEEFGQRVGADHLRGRLVLERESGREVVAYAAPLRDLAVASLEPAVHEIHEQVVGANYALSFVDDPFGANDRRSDARHLRRMRVAPQWSSGELVARLARALEQPDAAAVPEAQGAWMPASGQLRILQDTLTVAGRGRADLWRAGSQWTDDWSLEARVWIEDGQLWIVQPSQDLTEEWRWGGDRQGTHLQRRGPGRAAETLASFAATIEPRRWHDLKLLRRGAGVWIEWDGQAVSERPVYLPGRWRGSVGCVNWSRDLAGLRVERPRFRALSYEVRELSAAPDEQEVQAAIGSAPMLAALCPAWFEARGGELHEAPGDRDLLSILQRRYGFDIVPTVRVAASSATSVEAWLPSLLVRARETGWAGLRLDARVLDVAQRGELRERAERVSRESGWSGRPLLYVDGSGPTGSAAPVQAAQAATGSRR